MATSIEKIINQNQNIPDNNVGYLESVKGNKSIKRLWGSILLSSALFIGLLVVAINVIKPGFNMDNSIKVMESIGIGGLFLLGINIFQYWKGGR